MRALLMKILLFTLGLVVSLCPSAFAQDQEPPKPRELTIVDAAIESHLKEARAAEKAYQEAKQRSKTKLLLAYDSAITVAMNRGGSEGLDAANQLRRAKATVEAGDGDSPHNLPGMADVIKLVNGNTWFWHWEKRNRNNPRQFNLGRNGKQPAKPEWRVETRWTLTDGENLLVLMNEDEWKGFFIPTGREIGLFREKK